MFRFLYSSLLHCICCCCRIYARSKRRHVRTNKSTKHQGIEYVGTTSVDASWSELNPGENVNSYDNYYTHTGMTEEEIDDEINDVWNRMESRVPILVVISIIIGYICLGAIMFSNTEGWSMSTSVYFCYITLSTIGFGDYVCKKFLGFIFEKYKDRLFRYQE